MSHSIEEVKDTLYQQIETWQRKARKHLIRKQKFALQAKLTVLLKRLLGQIGGVNEKLL